MTIKRPAILLAICFALALTAQPGCDLENPTDVPAIDYCKVHEGHVNLPATWTLTSLTGSGTRTKCTNEDYNKKFEFALSVPIQMTRVIDDTGTPAFGGALNASFDVVDGSVSGRCITFTTVETVSANETVYRTFDGHFDEYQETIVGTFTGLGPAHCNVSGTFKAVIE